MNHHKQYRQNYFDSVEQVQNSNFVDTVIFQQVQHMLKLSIYQNSMPLLSQLHHHFVHKLQLPRRFHEFSVRQRESLEAEIRKYGSGKDIPLKQEKIEEVKTSNKMANPSKILISKLFFFAEMKDKLSHHLSQAVACPRAQKHRGHSKLYM